MQVVHKGMTEWGEAYYLPECPLNLVSVHRLSILGYKMAISADPRKFVATSPKGVIYEFVGQPDGLLGTGFLTW